MVLNQKYFSAEVLPTKKMKKNENKIGSLIILLKTILYKPIIHSALSIKQTITDKRIGEF